MTTPAHRNRHTLGFRILLWIGPILLDWYLRFVFWTSKVQVFHEEYDACKLRNEPTVLVSLHQGLFYFLNHFRDRGGLVMTSHSRDGDLVTAILQRFGFTTVRGSSSRGGKEALHEMISFARRRIASVGMAFDAPRGPYAEAKIGTILLAKESGLAIVPCAPWMRRKIMANNWDHTLIPLPFSRLYFSYGEPISVPPDASREKCEELRRLLGERTMELVFETQEAAGEPRQDFRQQDSQRATPQPSA